MFGKNYKSNNFVSIIMQEIKKHITLSQLAAKVGLAVASSVEGEAWVTAEISECKVSGSGHCYLSLVERDENGGVSRAEFRASIWAAKYRMIDSYFRSSTGSTLQQGMKILARVAINYHPVYGLSLVISDIDPSYTIGEAERERQQTIARLKADGLFELQREFALPIVAQRFAVISSATAAGFEDFIKQLNDSPYQIEVELFAAFVQGEQTERSIIEALSKIEKRARQFDAVIIIRGGGSASDLRWFDSYNICAAVASFPLPVLTGIGHEKDVSVTDMVAYHMFKTPTAVAAGLVDRLATVDARIENLGASVVSLAQNRLLVENSRLDKATHAMQSLTGEVLKTAAVKLSRLNSSIASVSMAVILKEINRLQQCRSSLNQSVESVFERQKSALELLASKIDGRNPRKILKMGYSIVKTSDGRSIKTINDAPRGTILDIELTDGTIKTEVR